MPNHSLNLLNSYQKQAVLAVGDTILVNSAVGSGKTTVLIQKIIHLCEVEKIAPESLVILTFTKKAAREIHDRLPVIWRKKLRYHGTFHSVASRILREKIDLSSSEYDAHFSILDEEQSDEIVARFQSKKEQRIKYQDLFGAFPSKPKLRQRLIQLRQDYRQYKQENNLMDFADLITTLDRFLETQALSFSWVIVDEFQDTDRSQAQVLKKLQSYGAKLFAVGDPNQTIYSWRGSQANIFAEFQRGNYQEMELPLNYRSTSTILEGARSLLLEGELLVASRPGGNRIIVKEHYSSFHEALYLAQKMKHIHQNSQVPYSEMAVLYRRQSQGETLSKVFREEEVPFLVRRKKMLADIPVLAWFEQVLKAALNPRNQKARQELLHHPIYNLKSTFSEHPLLAAWDSFFAFCCQARKACEVWEHFSLNDYLSPTSINFTQEQEYIYAFLEELLSRCSEETFAIDFPQRIEDSDYDLNTICQKVEGYSETGVNFLTLHSSKGLEFRYVFIITANEGNLPLLVKNQDLEEEKRLFFVGLTRAKDQAEVSYVKKTDLYGTKPKPSPYLKLLPESVVDWQVLEQSTSEIKELVQQVREKMTSSKEEENARKARHPKYGTGVVIEENEDMILVDFPEYGEKSFSAVFCPLQFDD